MEFATGGGWSRDLAWGLCVIVLNVVFHAISLGLINKDVASRLGGSLQHRHHVFLSVFVVGGAALSTAILHAIEVSSWAAAYTLLGALANGGFTRSVKRLDSFWAHHGFPVCHCSESLVVT